MADPLRVLEGDRVTYAPTSATRSTRPTSRSTGPEVVPTFRTLSAVNILYIVSRAPVGPGARNGQSRDRRRQHRQARRRDRRRNTIWRRSRTRIGSAARWRHSTRTGTCCSRLASVRCRPSSSLFDMMMDDLEEYWRWVFRFSPFTVWFNLTGQPSNDDSTRAFRESGFPVAVQADRPLRRRGGTLPPRVRARILTARWIGSKPPLAEQ